jgi:biotin--protein ligase
MNDIIIYVDQGVSGEALRQTVKSLQQEVDLTVHALKRMDAKQLLNEEWESKTALLIVPGGRDVFYHASLSGQGTEKVKRFVEKGGRYLGLCAGAYFGADAIEFEKGGRLEVVDKRSLEFFPGRAVGPAYGPGKYSYESDAGVEAAKISWKGEECFAYFNGGCYFDAANRYPNVEVLSSYTNLEERPAAIVECKLGKGKALLSGVHIEFCTFFLTRGSKYLEKVLPKLQEGEEKRRKIFREVLKGFGLKLK